jgi:general secretion pathway protein D
MRRARCSALVMAAASAAMASSVPVCRGASAATQPAIAPSTQPTTGPTPMPGKFSFNFKDAPVDAILDFLSQRAGFSILKDGPVDAHATILSKQPVSAEQAVTLLDSALKVNGFAVIRQGQILHIVTRDKARKGNVPVQFGNDPAAIAEGDELVTQVIPISNVSATKLRDDLKPLIATDADVTANDGSNSIIITDSSSAVRRLVTIIAAVDSHEATTAQLRVVQLKRANATATAKLIETLFKPEPAAGGQPQPGMPPQMQGGPGGPAGAGAGESQRHGQNVIAAADDRTNTLLVLASADSLKVVDEIVKQVDADVPNPAPAAEIHAFPLRFAAADVTAKLVTDIFKAPNSSGGSPFFYFFGQGGNTDEKKDVPVNAVSDDRTNTMIVTAPKEKMGIVEGLVRQLDTSPMVSAELKVFHLRFASADDAAKVITDMFLPATNDTGDNNRTYYFEVPPPEKQPKGVAVKVTSDTRTNSLLVSAPHELLDVIGKVVEELDADPTSEDTLFIYHLRNGQAQHLEYTLNVLFGNISNGNQQNQNQNQGQNQNQPNPFGQGQSASGASNNLSSSVSNNSTAKRNNATARQGGGGGGNVAQASNELTGKVLVVADPDTNSLLVTTASKYEHQVRQIIEDLDHPVAQVLIKVLIAEVTHDNSDDLGLDFSVLNTRASGKGQSGGTTFGAPTNGLIVNLLESNVTATLHALAMRNKLDVLSRPYILASDNQDANIMVGQIVPYVTNSQVSDLGSIVNTVEYRNIGIILDVTPHINPDGLVILDVNPQVSAISSTNIQISNGITSPVFDQRSASSRVGIMDGQTIVIGGLMQDQNNTTVQKVPLLGSIPLIGALFQRSQVEKIKTELLIFLTPHVAAQAEALRPMSIDETQSLRLTPSAVQPGMFEEHLRGMDRGAAPQTQPTQPTSPVRSINLGDPSAR